MGDATAGRQALLVMDMQPAVLARVEGAEGLLSRARDAIAAARAAGIPVLYVVVRFRPGLPEISARNLLLAGGRVARELTGRDEPRRGRRPRARARALRAGGRQAPGGRVLGLP